jgi:hypothetical protein
MIPLREIIDDFEVGIDTSLKYKVSYKRLREQWIIRGVVRWHTYSSLPDF